MKTLILALTFLAVIYTLECSNPLLSEDFYPKLPPGAKLTESTTLTNLTQCKRLNNQQSCCSQEGWDYFQGKFKEMKQSFEGMRTKKAKQRNNYNFKDEQDFTKNIEELTDIEDEKYTYRDAIEKFEFESCKEESLMDIEKDILKEGKDDYDNYGKGKGQYGKGKKGGKGNYGFKDGKYSKYDSMEQKQFRRQLTNLRFLQEEMEMCCQALTADCLACAEGFPVDEYCAANPQTLGCDLLENDNFNDLSDLNFDFNSSDWLMIDALSFDQQQAIALFEFNELQQDDLRKEYEEGVLVCIAKAPLQNQIAMGQAFVELTALEGQTDPQVDQQLLDKIWNSGLALCMLEMENVITHQHVQDKFAVFFTYIDDLIALTNNTMARLALQTAFETFQSFIEDQFDNEEFYQFGIADLPPEVQTVLDVSGLSSVLSEANCNMKEDEMAQKKKTRGGKKSKESVQKEYRQQYQDIDNKVNVQYKTMYQEQNKCLRALFKYQAGMMCLTCDANHAKFMQTLSNDQYSLNINQNTCKNLQKGCFQYLIEAQKTGQVQSSAFEGIKLQKLEDRVELLQMKYDYAQASGNATTDEIDGYHIKLTAAQDEYNLQKETFNLNTTANHLFLSLPDNCTNETSCQYICDTFIGSSGVQEEAITLSRLITSKSRLLAATITIGFSDDGYTPDSTENTEGFDTETFSEDPSANLTNQIFSSTTDDIDVAVASKDSQNDSSPLNARENNTEIGILIFCLIIVIISVCGALIVKNCKKPEQEYKITKQQYSLPQQVKDPFKDDEAPQSTIGDFAMKK